MARPTEKTHRLDVDTLREMRAAYGDSEFLADAMNMHVIDVRRVLRGDGLRPEDHAIVAERWQTIDPRTIQATVQVLYDQIRDDRARTWWWSDHVVADELLAKPLPGDLERRRRARLIAPVQGQGALDQVPLQRLHASRDAQSRAHARAGACALHQR